MTNGKTFTVTEQLNSEEDFDALQEVTTELEQAEARIEELEAENKRLKSMIADVIHDTGDDPKIMAASRAEWAARALAAEAKLSKSEALLAKAVVNIRTYAPSLVDGPEHDVGYYHGYHTALDRLLDTLAELSSVSCANSKGQDDE